MADIHDFTIETGNTFEIIFSYTDQDNIPLDLSNHCVFLRWSTNTGEEYSFSSTNVTTDYELLSDDNGQIIFRLPPRATQTYNFNSATYDLEIQAPNETYTGSGFEITRLVSGSITFINKSVIVDINDLNCDPYLIPKQNNIYRIADINDLQYNGSGIITTETGSGSDTITITDNNIINYADILINGFNYRYPQDLRILLTPPIGNTILLAGHEKIINNAVNFNIIFSNTAASDKFLYNGLSNEPVNITDKTNIIKYNNETLSANLSDLQGISSLGNWTLTIIDDDPLKDGSIDSWSIIINKV